MKNVGPGIKELRRVTNLFCRERHGADSNSTPFLVELQSNQETSKQTMMRGRESLEEGGDESGGGPCSESWRLNRGTQVGEVGRGSLGSMEMLENGEHDIVIYKK